MLKDNFLRAFAMKTYQYCLHYTVSKKYRVMPFGHANFHTLHLLRKIKVNCHANF